MMYNNTGDKRIQAKANLLIAEMAKVQAAWTGKTDYCKTPLTSHAHRHLLSIARCHLMLPPVWIRIQTGGFCLDLQQRSR